MYTSGVHNNTFGEQFNFRRTKYKHFGNFIQCTMYNVHTTQCVQDLFIYTKFDYFNFYLLY